MWCNCLGKHSHNWLSFLAFWHEGPLFTNCFTLVLTSIECLLQLQSTFDKLKKIWSSQKSKICLNCQACVQAEQIWNCNVCNFLNTANGWASQIFIQPNWIAISMPLRQCFVQCASIWNQINNLKLKPTTHDLCCDNPEHSKQCFDFTVGTRNYCLQIVKKIRKMPSTSRIALMIGDCEWSSHAPNWMCIGLVSLPVIALPQEEKKILLWLSFGGEPYPYSLSANALGTLIAPWRCAYQTH